MGFKLVKSDSFKRDVEFIAPDGTSLVIKGVEFKYLSENDWMTRANDSGDDAINELVLGWDEFEDAEGDDVEFDTETRDELMSVTFVQSAFVLAYAKALYGIDSKNFATSLAIGHRASARQAARKAKGKKKGRKRN